MADSVNIEDFAFNFEAEHIFADSLFGSDAVGNFLREMGYAKNALGNLMLEFADADTVAKIQDLPADHPLRVALSDAESGAGIVRHKGNASGGSQFGKNAFLRDAIDEIRTSGASSEAQRIALDNLFDWTRKLAKGEILDADGKPLGVMGNTEFAQVLDNAYRNGTGPNGSPKQYVDPVDIANGGNLPPEQQAEVARARQISTEVREYWEKPENSQVFSSDANKPDFDPLNDEGKFNGRGALAQKYAETLNRAGLISDESYNLALEELGSGKNSSAASRVVIRLTGEAAAQSKVLVTGDDPSYTKKVVSEYRAVAQASEIAPEATDDSRVLEEYENVSKQVAQEELNSGVLRGSFAEYGKGVKGIVARAATGITSSRLASGRAVGIGLIIAGADVLHDSFKKGLTEGDWSDFIIEGTKFGAVTVGSIAGLTILGGIAATIGGAVAAEVVVAGAIVVGAVGAAYALGDLIHKLAVDVGLAEAPIQQGAVPNNIQENINFITNVGEKVLLNDFLGKLGAPVLPFYNQKFIADDQDLHFADVVYGDDDKAELVYADNGAIVDTGGGADEVYHFGYGQVFGGAGQDVLVGKDAKVLHQGEDLYKWMNVLADQRDALNAKYQALNVERAQNGEPLFKILPSLPRSPQASEDIVLRLDGGTDNDIVFALGGERAITAGGLGRDWIYNTSSGGEIWGDVQGSVNLGGGHYAYFENGQQVDIADGHDNSDNFWYAPDVTIMDAQHSDVLKFYGLPLTGGDANGGLMGLGIGGLAGSAIGLANAMQGNLSDWTKGVYSTTCSRG